MTTDSLLTASAVLDHLVAAGAREFFFAPGSRSAPFVYSAAERDGHDLRTHVRLDERSAGFHALGAARATGVPSVVVTTSGTAVGNLLPAALEADHAHVPLVLLTADRPPELRGTGANQTTRQPGIFGDHVRAAVDIVVPVECSPERLRALVADELERVLLALSGDADHAPGPVHVNVALREPLQPEPDGPGTEVDVTAGGAHEAGWRVVDTKPPFAVEVTPQEIAAAVRDTATSPRRTVVLAGDGAGPAAAELARQLRLPVLAEPSSNARVGTGAIGPYRLLLDSQLGMQIERVLLVGRPTLSRPVGALLKREDVLTAAWQPGPVAWYEAGRRRETVLTRPEQVVEFTGRGAENWLRAWADMDRRARAVLSDELLRAAAQDTEHLPGPVVAGEVWSACLRDGAVLVAGSSNPVRDLDLAATPNPEVTPVVIANRGLAGIDGTTATAAGVSLATGRPVRVLVGDLTFLHDAGSLLRLRGERDPDLQVVVLDDRGGGIFSTLEHGALGEQRRWSRTVERFFGTEPTADLTALGAAYGVDTVRVSGVEELRAVLGQPIRGIGLVVVPATRQHLRATTQRLRRRLQEL